VIREPWIRVHARLIDKPVVGRMCAALNIKPPAAIGHLVTLWGSVAANASNGSLTDVPDDLLERWASWSGKRGALAAWVRANHTDAEGRISDWDDYQGPLENRRERERERVRTWREAQQNAKRTHDVTRTPVRTKRVRTQYGTRNVAQCTYETERNGTELQEQEQKQDQKLSPSATAKSTWLTPYLELWTSRVGEVTPQRAAKALAPVRKRHGDEKALAALTAYLDEPRTPDKPCKLEWFAENAARWIADAETPLIVDGVITERGNRLSR
jgi:hypothetical protein